MGGAYLRRRGLRGRRAVSLAFLLLIAASRSARANGAFPDSLSVIVPVDRPHETTLATNFGLISTVDDGRSWSWACESAVTNNGYLYQIGPPPQDRLFALSANGNLAFSDDRACTWTVARGAVASGSVVDLFPDPLDAQRAFALVSPDGKVGSQATYTLVVTHDGGSTFDLLLTAAKSQVLTSVEVPRLDPKTIDVTASSAPNFTPVLMRSTDDGSTWQTIDLGADFDASDARLIAIDPENANKLFLRATTSIGEALAVIDDAGAMVRSPVVLQAGRLTAFVRLSAGPILVAGEIAKEAFLYRSTDAGLTFTRLSGAPHLRALAARDGVLWGAADNKEDGFALAVSADQGETWQPVMRFDQVTEISACVRTSCQGSCVTEANLSVWPAAICGPDSLQGSVADASLPDGRSAAGEAAAIEPDGPLDPSIGVVASGPSGCGCEVDAARRPGWATGSLLVMVLLWRRKRGRAIDLGSESPYA